MYRILCHSCVIICMIPMVLENFAFVLLQVVLIFIMHYDFSYTHHKTYAQSFLSESVRLIEPTITICISKYQVLPVKSLISMECPTCDLKSQTILNNDQDLKGNMTSMKTLEESE